MDHEIVEVDTVRLSPVLWNSLVSEIKTFHTKFLEIRDTIR